MRVRLGLVFGVLAVAASASAAGNSSTNQGQTPNGKPFQYIQEQIRSLDARIVALDAKVDALASDLQQQINAIFGRLSDLESRLRDVEGQVATVQDAIDALSARVSANEDAVRALEAANAALRDQLAAVQAQLQQAIADEAAARQAGDAALADQQAQLADDLRRVESNLLSLINANTGSISSLQGQVAGIQQFLANLSSYDCSFGQAVKGVNSNGSLVCTQAGVAGNLTSTNYYGYVWAGANSHGWANLTCPGGTSLTASGYSHWPVWDYTEDRATIPYLNYYWEPVWGNYGYYLRAYQGYYYTTIAWNPYFPSHVTNSYPGGNTYSFALQNRPGVYYYSAYANWTASCARVQ